MARTKTPETVLIRQQIMRLSDEEIDELQSAIEIIMEARQAAAEKAQANETGK